MGRNNHALMTGLFLVALITATAIVIYWIGHFERERDLYVISTRQSVSGLNPESTVFFRGIAVGKVRKIQFDPKDFGTILVPIEVDKNITLTKGVYATLRLKGVTGLTQIELQDDGKIREVLPPGDDPVTRIPLVPSLTDKLMLKGEDLLTKAEQIMGRLNSLLNDENEKHIGDILSNFNTLTAKLADLQVSVDKALAGVPALSADAQKTLMHVNALTADLQHLTNNVQKLSNKAENLADTGKTTGDLLLQTTLPKINDLLSELQSTTTQVKRVATMLENNPQSLLLGPAEPEPGPGEPGYKEPK
ncbi:MlaD family protein [Methylobacter sp. YRD-M1]|uniref:MlaD family protein n=1 Tax=Methylobacter sp. YRD-M1 TaxID=2911520 RepID=UPI00227C299F|nr:MlaD family protein [Methylobacter sp. YRD-M1]WAK00951.1 MlaD family protein [Methylobacter sp. YRD-M1]